MGAWRDERERPRSRVYRAGCLKGLCLTIEEGNRARFRFGGFLRNHLIVLWAVSLAVILSGQSVPSPSGSLLGFNPETSKVEQDWEARFRVIPDAKRVHENMLHLAAHPHH